MLPSALPESADAAPTAPSAVTSTSAQALRVCLDLNVWCAQFLAAKAGRRGTASQILTNMVRRGRYRDLPVQLIISWGMLNRLSSVLIREWHVPDEQAELLSITIAQYAMLGPSALTPHLILGGAGVTPLRDAEDAHVLDTAFAGKADYLVTHNLADFESRDITVVTPGKEYHCSRGGHSLTILHTYEMLPRLRELHHRQKPHLRMGGISH